MTLQPFQQRYMDHVMIFVYIFIGFYYLTHFIKWCFSCPVFVLVLDKTKEKWYHKGRV